MGKISKEASDTKWKTASRAESLAMAAKIKVLRKETRAGPIECRKALELEKGDVTKAVEWLRAHGKDTPQKVWGEATYTAPDKDKRK